MADDTSSYPGATDTFDAIPALMSTNPLHQEYHEKMQDGIRKIQIELGNNPSDSDTSVRTRFVRIEGEIDDLETVDNTIQADVAAIQDAVMVRTGVHLTRTTNYNITTLATQLVSWENQITEVGGNWWASGVTVVCPAGAASLYAVTSINKFTGSFAPLYHVGFNWNSTMTWVPASAVSTDSAVTIVLPLSVADTLTVSLYNPSGGTVTADMMTLQVFKIGV